MANTTQYTEDEAANALAVLRANGGNAKKTAAMLGIPRTTLRQWADRAVSTTARPKQVPAKVVEDHTQGLVARLERVAMTAVEPGAMDAALSEASAKDRMIVAGIAIEKVQLLLGRPTSRNESLNVTLVASGSLNELGERTLTALRRR